VLFIFVVAVVIDAADAPGCASLSSQFLCISVVAVLAAAADAVLVANQVHPSTIERNPKA
jgi:hypothetical protein